MSLLKQIRADALAARKAHSADAGVLTTLIGEVDTKTKGFSPAREMTDAEVVAVVTKFIKGADETIKVLDPAKNSVAIAKAQAERTVLERYLPKQMTDAEIETFVRGRVDAGDNMGGIMSALKAEHAGRYDGKRASQIVRDALAAA
jgi:uncharacterized protein